MPLTTNGSYITVIDEVLAHWQQALTHLPPGKPLIVRLKEKDESVTRANLVTLRGQLETQQGVVQDHRANYFINRGNIHNRKLALLGQFNGFVAMFDAYYPNTDYYDLRPYAPDLAAGKDAFCTPMGEAMIAWKKINEGEAPAGVTLPLVLDDATDQGTFASGISGLAFAYAAELPISADLKLARARRNRFQNRSRAILIGYREAAEGRLTQFPELLDTLPRITPLPGHTPEPVNASAIFVAPNSSKIIWEPSNDAMLHSYQLRACAGPEWDDDDSEVKGTVFPGQPLEFVTSFGLNQPGAEVTWKVFVILTTGNEAGSAAMTVQRPLAQVA